RRARPTLTLSDALVDSSVHICQRLDGIALAIELAAARCRQLSPERIARELDDHYRLVAGGGRTQLPRQRTLDASVEWSHRLLDDSEQCVFRRLGAFVGWFPLDAAEGVVSAFGDFDAWSIVELITRLVDKSLLIIDEETNQTEPRYRMLETVRFYALERADAAHELEALREAHAVWWTNWIEALDVRNYIRPEQAAAIDFVYPNLRAALQWLTPIPERAAPLVRSLAQWMVARGQTEDFRTLLTPVATSLHATKHPAWRRTVAWMAPPAMTLGEIDFMLGPVTDALAAAELDDDTDDVASCLAGLAFLDPTAASWARLARFDESTAGAMQILGRSAFHALMAGNLRDECEALLQVVADAKRHTSFHVQAALPSLATVLLAVGDYVAVDRVCHELLDLIDEVGAASAATGLWVITIDAAAAIQRRDTSRIAEIRTRRDSRPLRGVPTFWAGAWDATIDIASHHLAATPLDIDLLVAVATSPFAATLWRPAYTVIAQELADRRLASPLRTLHDALSALPLADAAYHRMQTTAISARIAEVEGDIASEEAEWRSLLTLAIEQGARPMAIEALEAIAIIAADTAPARSARLFAAAQSARDSIGYRFRFPREQQRVDDTHTAIALALTPDATADALAHGQSMSLDEAAAYAQRTRGPRLRPTLGWESLTPTEREVARLVAEGATNPDIGRKLLMSVNTVKTHVGHIYTKLDITSRAQLAIVVAEHRSDSATSLMTGFARRRRD
ncbi:MAG: LuxR C-terminal-related transcriptional regulator, partial [Acidimicrobiales bacterium]